MLHTGQMVTIQIPESIFLRLRHVAEITHRPVEDVLATTVDAALPLAPDLPSDLAEEMAAMALFSDEVLWAAAESSLSPAQRRRLDQLSHTAGARPLTAAESAEMARLLNLYDQAVLRRARALDLLAQRGHPLPLETERAGNVDG